MEVLLFAAGAIFGAIFGYHIGCGVKQSPSEDEMLRRLIAAKAQRLQEKWGADKLKDEIDAAAEALARRA